METAKVFNNGRSQAVRIPKQYRFTVDEVYVNKIGEALILVPKDSLGTLFDQGASLLTEDFMSEKMPEDHPDERMDL